MNGAIMLAMTQPIELPSWMIPVSEPVEEVQGRSITQIRRDLKEKQFEIFFETVLDKLEEGALLTDILKDDQRNYDYKGFLRWIMKDAQRKSRYYEAQEIGTEIIVDEAIEIADGADGMEDVQRSKLRIDTRIWAVKSRNRKRFGEIKTVEFNQNISVNAALEMANNRLPSPNRVIDHEDIE